MGEHEQTPYSVHVEFRTVQSFLVAYSINLSRGGLFLETDQDIPTGAVTEVSLQVPGFEPIALVGQVAFRREDGAAPPGIGIELDTIGPLGAVVDQLISSFQGVQVLVLSGDRQDRTSLARSIKSIISTAEIMQAADASVAGALMTSEIDIALIDIDFDHLGGIAMLQAAKALSPPVPTIAITSSPTLREQSQLAGADELVPNPPSFAELQVVLMRALSKPMQIRSVGPAVVG